MAEKRKYEHPGSDAREYACAAHDAALDAARDIGAGLRFGGTSSPVGLSFKARLKSAQKQITDAHEWIARALAQQEIEDQWYTPPGKELQMTTWSPDKDVLGDYETTKCDTCNGHGTIEEKHPAWGTPTCPEAYVSHPCEECDGTGYELFECDCCGLMRPDVVTSHNPSMGDVSACSCCRS